MSSPEFEIMFASSEQDLRAVQALRYDVFVRELGADGPLVDHAAGLERDHFDPYSRHLMLLDRRREAEIREQIVGVYRLLDSAGATQAGGFYSEHEFDLTPLKSGSYRLLELGRSCLHPEYRGGTAMYHLWSALAEYVVAENYDILFGTASFLGTDQNALAAPLALLQHRHLAAPHLRPRARNADNAQVEPVPCTAGKEIDRKAAMMQIPALIKAYLRLGGLVGEGAYIDHDFNTTDVCLVLEVNKMNEKQRKLYARGALV